MTVFWIIFSMITLVFYGLISIAIKLIWSPIKHRQRTNDLLEEINEHLKNQPDNEVSDSSEITAKPILTHQSEAEPTKKKPRLRIVK